MLELRLPAASPWLLSGSWALRFPERVWLPSSCNTPSLVWSEVIFVKVFPFASVTTSAMTFPFSSVKTGRSLVPFT